MDRTPLPDGLVRILKFATRLAIAACAVPGSSGPRRVEELTGYSAGAISRWGHDGHADMIPLTVAAQLEFVTQQPLFSRAFADLTGHCLAPVGDAAATGATVEALMGDLVGIVTSSAAVVGKFGEVLADARVTPREATETMGSLAELQRVLGDVSRKLAVIAEQGGC